MTPELQFLSPASRGFAQAYTPAGTIDEMIEPDGALRPHWRMFVNMLDDLGPDEIRRRWDQAKRHIHDNGITHNVYGDPNGLDRPWELDFVPLLIPASQWTGVAEGLAQRARLLDRLLADIYGPNRAMAEGVLPPELVYANPGFLRSCHGVQLPGDRHLHLYAADLVRTSNGEFEVLGDRTQAPSGAGYTLENRIVLSRALPSVFRACNVQRLAPYFLALRQSLTALALTNRDNPRVVLLTPGPYNETYFEHAFLARYLGYTLVQGNDLTVRDARVYLKTLSGLQRVDVLLRRVDDDFCDPLELYRDSFLGVPGLLEAVREGNVAVANALGSGVIQAPGLMPFLPALCRLYLGEELKLPGVPTWWCGDSSACAYVLENLHEMVIKSAFPNRGGDPVFGQELSREELSSLADKIRSRPMQYVGQLQRMDSTLPAMNGGDLRPRRFVARAYLATSGDDYAVMSGGLARITHTADSYNVSLQKGGGSKDIWICCESPVSEISLLTNATDSVALSRGGGDLPSRIADDLFWLGRYVQRAEATSRIGRGVLLRLLDQSTDRADPTLGILMHALTGQSVESHSGLYERELIGTLLDPTRASGLHVTISNLHRLARLLRDRVSMDAWRILQNLEHDLSSYAVNREEPTAGVGDLLDRMIAGFAAFVGLFTDSMTRGQSWRFLDLGHRIERAASMALLLRDTLVASMPDELPLLETVLDISDSSLTYRRRYLTHLEVHAVVDLLLADEANPRSVAYQLVAIDAHLGALPREALHPHSQPDRQILMKLRGAIQLADLDHACRVEGSRRRRLESLLNLTLDNLRSLTVALAQTYFVHATVPRGLIGLGEEVSA